MEPGWKSRLCTKRLRDLSDVTQALHGLSAREALSVASPVLPSHPGGWLACCLPACSPSYLLSQDFNASQSFPKRSN